MNRFALLVLVGAVLAAGCAAGEGQPELPSATAASPALDRESVRILAIGDSFTRGEGVPAAAAWPSRLAEALARSGYEAEVELVAGTGWTARRAAAEMDRIDVAPTYDLVFIQVGVNDHFYGFGIDNYLVGLEQLGEDALQLTEDPGHVGVLSVVDWRVTPFGQDLAALYRSPDVTDHNAALVAFAADRGFAFIDVTAPSLAQQDDASLIAEDGLHASATLYAQWVEGILLPLALSQLES